MYIQAHGRNLRKTAQKAKDLFQAYVLDKVTDKAARATLEELVLNNPSTDWFTVCRVLIDHFPELSATGGISFTQDELIKGAELFYDAYDLREFFDPRHGATNFRKWETLSIQDAKIALSAYLYEAEFFDSVSDAENEAAALVRFILNLKQQGEL